MAGDEKAGVALIPHDKLALIRAAARTEYVVHACPSILFFRVVSSSGSRNRSPACTVPLTAQRPTRRLGTWQFPSVELCETPSWACPFGGTSPTRGRSNVRSVVVAHLRSSRQSIHAE